MVENKKPLFIALEGIDGSGKSTQIALLKSFLTEHGHKVYCTREPSDRFIGKTIRSIFNHTIEAHHKTIAALYAADRLDHLLNTEDGIIKQLEEGYTVITDRYYFSSYAYHSVHMPMEWVIHANSMAADLLRPDINIFIDISPEESMHRIAKGRSSIELYESLEILSQVRDKYFESFKQLASHERIEIVDGHKSVDEISMSINAKIKTLLH